MNIFLKVLKRLFSPIYHGVVRKVRRIVNNIFHPQEVNINLDGKYSGLRISCNNNGTPSTKLEVKDSAGNWVYLTHIQSMQINFDADASFPVVTFKQYII